MTPDEHAKERMRNWVRWTDETSVYRANARLAEFDKRFPAPSAAAPVEPVADAVPTETLLAAEYAQGWNKGHAEGVTHGMAHHATELAALRQKAQLWDELCSELGPLKKKAELWDAVRDGKVRLHNNVTGTLWWVCWGSGVSVTTTATVPTAEEAVESAIAQGALK